METDVDNFYGGVDNLMAKSAYEKDLEQKQILRLREITNELPVYVRTYFRSIAETTQPRTRIGYAYDIKYFFEYLKEANPALKNTDFKDISCDDLNRLTAADFEDYLDYITLYCKNGQNYTNEAASKKRKLCALRGFFRYLYQTDQISEDVSVKVRMPKVREHNIIRMETDEVVNFLDNVEFGNKLTDHQQAYHEKLKTRDLALLTLMLSTGIRVSECVGLNITDIDFDNDQIRVLRKGGNESTVYFSDEAETVLREYLEERRKITPKKGSEDALFLSSQRSRISVRSVEYLVKKYARVTNPLKHITPHKLRSTYGTALYKETGDIYLVADVLGHKDVNTTRKHYADMDDERKRAARNKVQLREDE